MESEIMEDGLESKILSVTELKERVGGLPQKPGVYIMRDAGGEVIYVGKAVNLRSRVRSYFTRSGDERYFVRLLDRILSRIDFIITSNEREALLLEANLIKKHRPRYNIRLRDDKNYLLIRVDGEKKFPRLDIVRRFSEDGAKYFGPYHSARSARAAARFASNHFRIRICSDRAMKNRNRPCIQHHMGRCSAPCVLEVDPVEYSNRIAHAIMFLSGRHGELGAELQALMEQASESMEYERAAKYRDVIRSLAGVMEPQNVLFVRPVEQDIFGLARRDNRVEICILETRAGRLTGRRSFLLKRQEFPDAEVLSSFLGLYYMEGRLPPREVLVSVDLDDEEALASELSARKKLKVTVKRPRRGTKRRLVEMAVNNARESLAARAEGPDRLELAEGLGLKLRLSRMPVRMECFDVSHTGGGDVRAAMAVFVKGEPAKNEYRIFKIRGNASQTSDDYASMEQVIRRRVERALDSSPGWEMPDLMVVDGGKGQLTAAEKALKSLGVKTRDGNMELLAIAKGEIPKLKEKRDFLATKAAEAGEEYKVFREADHVYLPNRKDPIPVKGPELLLLAHLRDEAHRFALAHHRKARSMKTKQSILDEIPGVGDARKKKLLNHFGSVAAVAKADMESLLKAGIPKRTATQILKHFGGESSRKHCFEGDYYEEVERCGPCLKKLVRQMARMTAKDQGLKKKVIQVGDEMLEKSFVPRKTPAEVATEISKSIKEMTGVRDPFKEHKRKEIETARRVFSNVKIKDDDLFLMELAVAGNSVDYFKTPKEAARDLRKPVEFALDDRAVFLEKMYSLSGREESGDESSELLYLADNAAELLFDIPCLQSWHKKGIKVVLVLKGGPVQNDATREDLENLAPDGLPFEVIDNGTDAVGTNLEKCSDDFRCRFMKAGLILAKGMANFETLRSVQTPDILFLLLAKCEVNAGFLGVKEGQAAAVFRCGNDRGNEGPVF